MLHITARVPEHQLCTGCLVPCKQPKPTYRGVSKGVFFMALLWDLCVKRTSIFLSVCLSVCPPVCLSIGGVSPPEPSPGEQQSVLIAVVSGNNAGLQGCEGDQLQHFLEERPGLLRHPAPLPPGQDVSHSTHHLNTPPQHTFTHLNISPHTQTHFDASKHTSAHLIKIKHT